MFCKFYAYDHFELFAETILFIYFSNQNRQIHLIKSAWIYR